MIEMDSDIAGIHTKAASARHGAYGCLIATLTFAVYSPVRTFAFLNFDDDQYIVDNPFVRSGFTVDNVRSAFLQSRGGHYHPLTWLSHMLDVSWFGLQAGPAHLVNAAIHAVTTGLTFGFALRCTTRAPIGAAGTGSTAIGSTAREHRLTSASNVWTAASVALIFGLHPLRLESVAWLAERKDVLSMSFALLTLHAWLWYQDRPSPLRYLTTATALGLGLLCKPTLVTLPMLLLGLDLWLKPNRQTLFRLGLEKLPLLALATASVLTTTLSQHHDGALQTLSFNTVGDRLTTAAVALLAYFGKLFWPTGLGVFYPLVTHPPGVGVGAVCGVAALFLVFTQNRHRAPGLMFGWCWFVVAPLPVIGLVQFGGQAFADRWTYLPHLGLILGAGISLQHAVSFTHYKLVTSAALVALTTLTLVNMPHWKNSETLFRHTLLVAPNNFLAHNNLGNALDAAGELAEATVHYEAAVRLNPTYPEALNNLGTARARAGRLAEAEQAFARALDIRPSMSLAGYNLGLVRSQLGQPLAAATTWLRVLQWAPEDARTLASANALVERHLLPSCAAGTLKTSARAHDDFVRALDGWQRQATGQHLREQLQLLATCLGPGAL